MIQVLVPQKDCYNDNVRFRAASLQFVQRGLAVVRYRLVVPLLGLNQSNCVGTLFDFLLDMVTCNVKTRLPTLINTRVVRHVNSC